jgi:signal peptidase I
MTVGSQPSRARAWGRTSLYVAGTGSMLVISMACSLVLWIALPWAFLGWSPTLVTSGSMRPLVSPGDVVMIRPAAPTDLAVNTVVLYDRPDTGRILHRIVEVRSDGTVQTEGDANASPDSELVHPSDVRGVAVLAVPWIGRPSLWVYQRRIPLLVVAGVALLAALRLAPRSFDPAFDPWGGANRVNPAEVLLGRRLAAAAEYRAGTGLLPEAMRGVVLDRLAAQTQAAERRTAVLLDGLS